MTIMAFLPPISSESRLCIRPQVSPMIDAGLGGAGEGDDRHLRDARPAPCPTVSPRPCTSWMTSGGSPASSRISTSRCTVCGTSSDGLMITAFPHSERREHLPGRDREREVERRDEPDDADRPAVAHRPLASAARTAPCGRRAGGPRWPRSRRCRCPPARRRGSRRAPCPSRGSSRRRSPPCARPAGRRPGGARRRAPAPASATRARSRAWPSGPPRRRRAASESGKRPIRSRGVRRVAVLEVGAGARAPPTRRR